MKFSFKRISRKGLVFGVSAGVALGLTGAAFAFFTSTGTGTGSGNVGTANNVTVVGTETTPLFPGGVTGIVTFTASNSGSSPEQLSGIHLTTVTPDSAHSGCTMSYGDFSMADVVVPTQVLPAHASNVAVTPTGTLVMADSTSNQDLCQGATLTLGFTTS